MTGRPQNDLLRQLNHQDFELLAPHLQPVEVETSHILHHAGDGMAAVHFPCGPTLVSFAVPVEDDREVESLLVGRERSATLREVFSRYADCQFAQLLQTAAFNAAHSIEQRAAKWIISAQEHIGVAEIPLIHEQLAGMLASPAAMPAGVLQMFEARRILATRHGAILILGAAALEARACSCNDWVKRHFDEVLGAATAGDWQTSNVTSAATIAASGADRPD